MDRLPLQSLTRTFQSPVSPVSPVPSSPRALRCRPGCSCAPLPAPPRSLFSSWPALAHIAVPALLPLFAARACRRLPPPSPACCSARGAPPRLSLLSIGAPPGSTLLSRITGVQGGWVVGVVVKIGQIGLGCWGCWSAAGWIDWVGCPALLLGSARVILLPGSFWCFSSARLGYSTSARLGCSARLFSSTSLLPGCSSVHFFYFSSARLLFCPAALLYTSSTSLLPGCSSTSLLPGCSSSALLFCFAKYFFILLW